MSDPRVMELIDRAFDYRGYVTVSRHDGSKLVGFIYERGPTHVELFDDTASERIRISSDDIADVELTGEDIAAKAHTIWERRKDSLEPAEMSARQAWETEQPTLLVVGLPMELRAIANVLRTKIRGSTARGRLGGGSAVGVAVGLGGSAVRAIAAERPRLVVTCGFSGALDPSLSSGDVVLATSVREEHGESMPVAKPLLRAARRALGTGKGSLAEGEIVCATRVAATLEDKIALARPGRLAVDLESWPTARAAEQAGIPWLAIRVVLDPLDVDLPAFAREPHASYLGPAFRHMLSGGRSAFQLAHLGVRAWAARRSLERALRHVAPALAAFGRTEARP